MMENRRTIAVSAVQFACVDDNFINANAAERLVREAQQKGADIILFQIPSLRCVRHISKARREGESLSMPYKPYGPHPTLLRMQNLAKELGVVILVGIFDETDNTYYNMIVVIDADGTELGSYQKSQTPNDSDYQEGYYSNLENIDFKVFQTRYAKIGVGICWDHWFPEPARDMVLHGAEILFYPTVIGPESEDAGLYSRDHWKRVMQGHSGVNGVPLVGTRIGKEMIHSEYGMSGNSLTTVSVLLGDTGEIVESADGEEEAILVAQFDLDELKSRRESWGTFRDRRPEH